MNARTIPIPNEIQQRVLAAFDASTAARTSPLARAPWTAFALTIATMPSGMQQNSVTKIA